MLSEFLPLVDALGGGPGAVLIVVVAFAWWQERKERRALQGELAEVQAARMQDFREQSLADAQRSERNVEALNALREIVRSLSDRLIMRGGAGGV